MGSPPLFLPSSSSSLLSSFSPPLLFSSTTSFFFFCFELSLSIVQADPPSLFSMCVWWGVCVHMCHSEPVEARGQPAEVGSVLTLCGIWESSSGYVTRQQVPSAFSLALSFTWATLLTSASHVLWWHLGWLFLKAVGRKDFFLKSPPQKKNQERSFKPRSWHENPRDRAIQ